jgi:aldose 1-epimerase
VYGNHHDGHEDDVMDITREQRVVVGQATQVVVVREPTTGLYAEVWPGFGFNCLRWSLVVAEQPTEILDYDPQWATNPVPTRSGHPILFPFPNRLEAGEFNHGGAHYRLPCNESNGKNAIHGFTPMNRWRLIEASVDGDHATIHGQFQLSQDRPDMVQHWPADFTVDVRYLFVGSTLRVSTTVAAPATAALPCGLGYHPYFRLAPTPDVTADELILQIHATHYWMLNEALPTGVVKAVSPELDFTTRRAIGSMSLDGLCTGLPTAQPGDLRLLATLRRPGVPGQLEVWADGAFREVQVFVPPHRRSVAIEPYTCATNAANMPDAGWRTVEAGQTWQTTVEYRWCGFDESQNQQLPHAQTRTTVA